jgi:hypothetical protein
VFNPTIWFEAPGSGKAGFCKREPKGIVAIERKYAIQIEEPCDELMILRRKEALKDSENFWSSSSPLNGLAYPKLIDWAREWMSAWNSKVMTNRYSQSNDEYTVLCSQLVYLTLTTLGAIPDDHLFHDFISPTQLSIYLKDNGFYEP